MTYRLFVSDGREAFDEDFITVQTVKEAKETVETLGFPSFVSFDATAKNETIDLMYWLLDKDRTADWWMQPSRFGWEVHSNFDMGVLVDNTFKEYKKYKFR